MNVTVRVFASYAEIIGSDSITVSVSDPATVGDLRRAIAELSASLPPQPIVAVNESYATDDLVISPDDDIAVIPPVAGG